MFSKIVYFVFWMWGIVVILSVHLSRRLKRTIVIMRRPSVVVTFHIFDFSSERNSTKLDKMKDFNILYQVFVFSGRSEKQDGHPCLLLAETFLTSLIHWTKFNETWQEARSQCPLPSLCFLGRSEKQDGRPGLWLDETFRLLLWTEFNETWQEARSQCPLLSLCFSGRSEKTSVKSWSRTYMQTTTWLTSVDHVKM